MIDYDISQKFGNYKRLKDYLNSKNLLFEEFNYKGTPYLLIPSIRLCIVLRNNKEGKHNCGEITKIKPKHYLVIAYANADLCNTKFLKIEKHIKRTGVNIHNEIKEIDNKPSNNISKKQNKTVYEYAKEMRKNPTEAEYKFSKLLQKHGLKYKQQKPIIYSKEIKYIADFLVGNTVIEIDGDYHLSKKQTELDNIRTNRLNELGYKVIRVLNNDVDSFDVSVLKL